MPPLSKTTTATRSNWSQTDGGLRPRVRVDLQRGEAEPSCAGHRVVEQKPTQSTADHRLIHEQCLERARRRLAGEPIKTEDRLRALGHDQSDPVTLFRRDRQLRATYEKKLVVVFQCALLRIATSLIAAASNGRAGRNWI